MLRFMNEVHDRPQKLSNEVGVRVVMGMVDMGVSKNSGTPKWMVYNGKPY